MHYREGGENQSRKVQEICRRKALDDLSTPSAASDREERREKEGYDLLASRMWGGFNTADILMQAPL